MTQLKRKLGLPLMLLYGLGTILGAGIYVLTGVVVAEAGQFAPIAFLLAALVALPTAYSYSVLSRRFPKSAGEALYVNEAWQRRWITSGVGLLVILVGIVSAATITRGFVGYLDFFIAAPDALVIVLMVAGLILLACYGVLESVALAAAIALLEILGLLLVITGGLSQPDIQQIQVLPSADTNLWIGVVAGAFIAFYAFIGFEDIVNMAEETINPGRVLPLAIMGSLTLAGSLYFLVTYITVATVPLHDIAASEAPMALIVEKHGMFNPQLVALISMLAVINGALVQIIMASRVIYGLGDINQHAWFSAVNPRTQTPVNATLIVGAAVLTLALLFDVKALASLTSAITLGIFFIVNLALCQLQVQDRVLNPMPWIAAILCGALLLMSFNLA